MRLSADFPTVVRVTNVIREYGEQNPELAYTIDGAALRGIPQLSCEADQQSAVGEYPIVIDKGSVENMNVTYVGGTLTVTKAPLTVYVDDYSRLEGEENPIFTILYDGFKNGETPDVLIEAPTVTTDAKTGSPMGEYDIIVSGGDAQNYEFIYVNGKLTVTMSDDVAEIIASGRFNVYTLRGQYVAKDVSSLKELSPGIYILRPIDGRLDNKKIIKVIVK